MSKRKRLLKGQVGYGLITYRRGTPSIYIHTEIFKGDERKRQVNLVRDMLNDWQLTPFENEGAIRTGIRSSLCLQGYSWQRSDEEASLLVNSAFTKMGVERPTWEQGQPEYTVPRENCAWCYKALPEEYLTKKKNIRFCSSICAKAMLEAKDTIDRKRRHAFLGAITRLMNRENAEPVKCPNCNRLFRPERSARIYCSEECYGQSKIVRKPKPCLNCEKIFLPKRDKHRFCCMACVFEYEKTHGEKARCDYCRKKFVKWRKTSRFCCRLCRQHMSDLATGNYIPKRLTAPVFDFFFSRAV